MRDIDILVSGEYVLPVDEGFSVINDGAVAISGGRILEVGLENELRTKYRAEAELGGKLRAILPGLVNTHTHVPMVYFRGMADDIPLKSWLEEHIWPAEGAWLGDEFCHDASLLSALEMVKAGITTYNDMYFFGDAIARATRKIGMRGVVGAGILDFPSKSASTPEEYLSNAEALINNWKDDDLIVPCVAPHAPYTCSPENMTRSRELAEKYDVPLHVHLSETRWERDEIRSRYGKAPAELLDSIGFLSERVVAAHCVWLSDEEIEIMARSGATVSHCIESNLKLASGIAPVVKMMDAGVRVTLGTDGAASNNDLSMFSEMSTAARVHKAVAADPTVMDSRTVLMMATRMGAEALGLGNVAGSLEPGKAGDLIVVNLDRPHLTPLYDVCSHLVYAASAADVESVVIGGRLIVEEGRLKTAQEEEILGMARQWKKKITGR